MNWKWRKAHPVNPTHLDTHLLTNKDFISKHGRLLKPLDRQGWYDNHNAQTCYDCDPAKSTKRVLVPVVSTMIMFQAPTRKWGGDLLEDLLR